MSTACKPGATALEVWRDLSGAGTGQGWRGHRRHRRRGRRQPLCDDLHPGKLFRIAVKDGKSGTITELKPSSALDHADALRAFGNGFLLIEGAGRLDKITVSGDAAQVEVIKDGLTEPVSVVQIGDTGWVAEGKLSYVIGENKSKDPGPFTLKPIALPK